MNIIKGFNKSKSFLSANRFINLSSDSILQSSQMVFGEPLDAHSYVQKIVDQVRNNGDQAIKDLVLKIEGHETNGFVINQEKLEDAYNKIPKNLQKALTLSSERISEFHKKSLPKSWYDETEGYGQNFIPVNSVGAYIPGGTARYPSTVLMSTIPAKIAGVKKISITCPINSNGDIPDSVLAAAYIAKVDKVYGVGGAQAVAALAYGTETIEPVDIICGPGNLFVTLAKKIVFGDVGIDGLYGPTETLVIADNYSNPTLVAADLIAQAEHDELAKPILITNSNDIATKVQSELDIRVSRITRNSIAQSSLQDQGAICVVDSIEESLTLANIFAPEHLCLAVESPEKWVPFVLNAGMIFLGEFSHEVLGDYGAGPSHVMPTAGTARFNSGLGVHTFQKTVPIVNISKSNSIKIGELAATIAKEEGLTGHAEAAEIRKELFE